MTNDFRSKLCIIKEIVDETKKNTLDILTKLDKQFISDIQNVYILENQYKNIEISTESKKIIDELMEAKYIVDSKENSYSYMAGFIDGICWVKQNI